MRPLPTILCGAVALTAALVLAPAATAATAPCVPGTSAPRCSVWTGKVTFVADGDTLDVRVGGRVQRVRIAGLQAMELRAYSSDPARRRGDCNGLAAVAALDRMVRRSGARARLTAQRPGTLSRGRPVRSVALRIGGRWRDVGSAQLAAGEALWWPVHAEPVWNARYRVLAQRAATAGRGIYDPDRCGAGPSPRARLSLWVNWDADGNDHENPGGEWVRIRDGGAPDGSGGVPIGGWTLRDSALRGYRFPPGARVPAGGGVTLSVGSGSSGGGRLHWGQARPVFENATGDDEDAMGDGAYLFDPRGNLRAFSIFPCRVACADPLAGRIELRAEPDARQETVTVENVSAGRVELEGYRLEASARGYPFPAATALEPGEALQILIDAGSGASAGDTRLRRHWHVDRTPILPNAGGAARLTTFDGVTVACTAWGSGRC